MKDRALTCPSAPAEIGSVLLGVVAERGQVAYLSPNVPVTPTLLDSLEASSVPLDNRLRFAGPCIAHRCIQWKGGEGTDHCGLIEHAVKTFERTEGPDTLPQCGIRATCRWIEPNGIRHVFDERVLVDLGQLPAPDPLPQVRLLTLGQPQ